MAYGPEYGDLLEALVRAYDTTEKRKFASAASGVPEGTVDVSGASRDAWKRILYQITARQTVDRLRSVLETDRNTHITAKLEAWIVATQTRQDPRIAAALDEGWIDPALLPKLIDRTRTSQNLIYYGTQAIRDCLSGRAAQKHNALVVIGRADDAVDALVDRFLKWDSKQTWLDSEEALASHGGWAEAREWRAAEIKVELIGDVADQDLAAEIERPTVNALGAGGLHDRFPNAALLAVTSVTLNRNHRHAKAVVGAWTALWHARLAEPVDKPVLPVLCLVHAAEPEDRRGLLGIFRRSETDDCDPRCKSTYEALRAESATDGPLELQIGQALGRLETSHFDTWKDDQQLSVRIAQGKYRALHEMGTALFGEREKPRRVRKQIFVEQVELLAIFADEPDQYRSDP